MAMHALPTSLHPHVQLFRVNCAPLSHIKFSPSFLSNNKTLISPATKLLCISNSRSDSSEFDPPLVDDDNYDESGISTSSVDSVESKSNDGVDIEIEELGNNSRRIRSQIAIDVTLETVWNLLTDYERLTDFIPGLAACQLLEKRENFARLFQIGQQNLAFGLKFNAKGIVDCYEKDLENLPCGQRRDIEFKMIEGDFKTFEGKWSIEQTYNERHQGIDSSAEKEFQTTLYYNVDVEPKLWLPVRLVEGRLCREIKLNLLCIRNKAWKTVHNTLPTH